MTIDDGWLSIKLTTTTVGSKFLDEREETATRGLQGCSSMLQHRIQYSQAGNMRTGYRAREPLFAFSFDSLVLLVFVLYSSVVEKGVPSLMRLILYEHRSSVRLSSRSVHLLAWREWVHSMTFETARLLFFGILLAIITRIPYVCHLLDI